MHNTIPSLCLEPLQLFLTHQKIPAQNWPTQRYIAPSELPKPYDFLLTQPLMTVGIAQHYQRTPKIRAPLYVLEDSVQQKYSRAVMMVVDANSARDDALLADASGESKVVELGLITMNFNALPPGIITAVKTTATPLGALLANHRLQTQNQAMHFFALECTQALTHYLPQAAGKMLFGRTNMLVNETGDWLARVVEILT